MNRLGIIFGGKSSEHEVSLHSAASVIKNVDKDKHELVLIGITKEGEWRLFNGDVDEIDNGDWEKNSEMFDLGEIKEHIDFALPILHGRFGEDGTIQGLFEMLDLPYAGCGVLGSSLAMDKVAAKMIFMAAGIATCDFRLVEREDLKDDIDEVILDCEEKLGYPMFIKPANAGSSVGISRADNREELKGGLSLAAEHDRRIIVEEGLDARELETGVIGNDICEAAEVGEIIAKNEFYDYQAKYSGDCGTEIIIPAEISKETREELRRMAVKTYKALDCSGFARVDFMQEKKSGKLFVNEVNTIPGFTKYSMFSQVWESYGVLFGEQIERIIGLGYERYNARNKR